MKKILNKEVVLYIVFGVLTTVVNFTTYFALTRWLTLDKNMANFIAIAASILFAFVTNEKFVFQSSGEKGVRNYLKLFLSFLSVRIIALLLDVVCFYVLATLFNVHDGVTKVLIAFLVVVFNYFMSKLFVFKK